MEKILVDREKRYNTILELIEKYDLPVVCGKINYPGKNKNTKEGQKLFLGLMQSLKIKFHSYAEFSQVLGGYDGSSILIVVKMDPLEAKYIGVDIEENHCLGRLFDIDVYSRDGSSIGREKINKDARRCILCNDDARVCIKTNRHSLEEIIERINRLIAKY
ncbi:MAG: citrate lyase holo-[acyl-carrier protein] synthase [Marinisporobacter sp.]|jgi:holo-ACP synthase|nr:citrate lyase holo-[acyl-carrier protein] synthase [Marinisporobacter sp.]